MEVKLVMFKADGQRRDFQLKGEVTTLGRNTDCEMQIPLATISRKHCQIRVEGDRVFVRDMGSSNGTFVNNQRVQEADLSAGDQIVLGPVVFTVVIDGMPETISPVRTRIVDKPADESLAGGVSPAAESPPAEEPEEALRAGADDDSLDLAMDDDEDEEEEETTHEALEALAAARHKKKS